MFIVLIYIKFPWIFNMKLVIFGFQFAVNRNEIKIQVIKMYKYIYLYEMYICQTHHSRIPFV